MTETGTISIAGSVANNHSNVADGDLAKDVALVLEGARQRPVSVLSVRRRSCEFAALVPC